MKITESDVGAAALDHLRPFFDNEIKNNFPLRKTSSASFGMPQASNLFRCVAGFSPLQQLACTRAAMAVGTKRTAGIALLLTGSQTVAYWQ